MNVADRLRKIARERPDAVAVASRGRGPYAGEHAYTQCTFGELDEAADAAARGLVDLGVAPGDRLALLVRPGVELVSLVFGMLRSGATMVLIDPGMGISRLLACLATVDVDGFVAISPVQAARRLLRRRFANARYNVTVGRRLFWGGINYQQLLRRGRASQHPLPEMAGDDLAAIIFTSGSTGPPKGVLYTHAMFDAQTAAIQQQYDLTAGGADLSCFPLFGLFNSAMGVTTVFPQMDFSRPASCRPERLLEAARDWQVTQAFASPAVWDRVSRYCQEHATPVPTLRKIFSCGAPVASSVLERTLTHVAPTAQMHTPYGATEALPVATVEAQEVLGETAAKTDAGAGVCVGQKYPTVEWRVIAITDEPIAKFGDTAELPPGEIGELCVAAAQVSPAYFDNDPANELAKIRDGETIWHRMGDVGYLDEQGRFWYCGRKAHCVETLDRVLYTIPVEAILNTHPDIRRTALVGVGARPEQTPVVVYEPEQPAPDNLPRQLRQLAADHRATRGIDHFLPHGPLPVDVRHNSKINRERLAEWAATQLQGEPAREHA